MLTKRFLRRGIGIVEVIVAIALFMIIAATGISTVVRSFGLNQLGGDETEAHLLAQEGIEAVRAIRNQNWSTVSPGSYGLANESGFWELSGTSNAIGKFERQVVISQTQRNGSGAIVTTGGVVDPDVYRVESSVSWEPTASRTNEVSLVTYLSQYTKQVLGDWSAPQVTDTVNVSGTQNGWRSAVQGNYLYVIIQSGSPNFLVLDVSDPLDVNVVGTLTLTGGPRDLFVLGNYVYIASTQNNQELQIVSVANPSTPVLTGTYNAPGSANAFSVTASGSVAYLTRDSSSDPEFYSVNVSNPSSPSLRDTLEIGSDVNDLAIIGSYAFVSTDSNTQEMLVISISNPSDIAVASSLNLPGSQNGETISGFGNTVVMGEAGSGAITIISVASPLSPSVLGNFNAGSVVRDLVLKDNDFIFIASDDDAAEFQVIDIANPSAPSQFGFINLSDDLNGVSYDAATDSVFVVGDADSQEILVIRPS